MGNGDESCTPDHGSQLVVLRRLGVQDDAVKILKSGHVFKLTAYLHDDAVVFLTHISALPFGDLENLFDRGQSLRKFLTQPPRTGTAEGAAINRLPD